MSFSSKLKPLIEGINTGFPSGINLGMQIGRERRAEQRMATQDQRAIEDRIRARYASDPQGAIAEATKLGLIALVSELQQRGPAQLKTAGANLAANVTGITTPITSAPVGGPEQWGRRQDEITGALGLMGQGGQAFAGQAREAFPGAAPLPPEATVVTEKLGQVTAQLKGMLGGYSGLESGWNAVLASANDEPAVLQGKIDALRAPYVAAGGKEEEFPKLSIVLKQTIQKVKDDFFLHAYLPNAATGNAIREHLVKNNYGLAVNNVGYAKADLLDMEREQGITEEQRAARSQGSFLVETAQGLYTANPTLAQTMFDSGIDQLEMGGASELAATFSQNRDALLKVRGQLSRSEMRQQLILNLSGNLDKAGRAMGLTEEATGVVAIPSIEDIITFVDGILEKSFPLSTEEKKAEEAKVLSPEPPEETVSDVLELLRGPHNKSAMTHRFLTYPFSHRQALVPLFYDEGYTFNPNTGELVKTGIPSLSLRRGVGEGVMRGLSPRSGLEGVGSDLIKTLGLEK